MIIVGKYPALRLRRGRSHDWIRRLLRENTLSVNDLILPIFIVAGKNKKIPVKTMPGIYRYSVDNLNKVIANAISLKIPMVALFPYIDKKLKNENGTEALNKNNLVCSATRMIKKKFKDKIGIMCDVALDPYTSHGHDGLFKSKKILNDETNEILIKQALIQAAAGCDIIAPSDMMDGRVGLIRKALDIRPGQAAILDSLAWVLYLKGSYKEAAKYSSLAYSKDQDPEIVEHHYLILLKNGNSNEAKYILERSIQNNPNSENLLKLLENSKNAAINL